MRLHRAFEDLEAHGVAEVIAGIQDGGGVAGESQLAGHGIPAESIEVNAHASVNGFFHAGQHVCISGDQDDVADVALEGGDDHIGYQARVHCLLGTPVAPFDELARAQLHTGFAAQGSLVTVGAGIGDSVIPILSVDRLF